MQKDVFYQCQPAGSYVDVSVSESDDIGPFQSMWEEEIISCARIISSNNTADWKGPMSLSDNTYAEINTTGLLNRNQAQSSLYAHALVARCRCGCGCLF